jgi:hypothetical protein
MKIRKVNKRRSDRILTILVAVQPGGAHHQGPRQAHVDPGAGDKHFYNKCSKIYGLGRLEVQILCYIRNKERSILSEASNRTQDWFKENLQEVWDKEVWPPSSPDILCGASQSYRSMQSLTTKPRI